MFRKNLELWYALVIILVVTVAYLVVYQVAGALTAASHLVGHGLGIVGFLLMVMTEVLYSLRKRSNDARWGSMASWLRFHMVTGLVGSYMVLLHPAMRFQGLAGAVALLTAIVVVSGLFGRYVYTLVPRATDGTEREMGVPESSGSDAGSRAPEIQAQLVQRLPVGRQPDALARTRRVLAIWHAVHVPLSLVLMVLAIVHIFGAVYYATLLH